MPKFERLRKIPLIEKSYGSIYRTAIWSYRQLYYSKPFQFFFQKRVRRMTREALKVSLRSDADYEKYLEIQMNKSFGIIKSSPFELPALLQRTVVLVAIFKKFLPQQKHKNFTVLCVGCRSSRELDYIESTCGVKARGLDLFSEDSRIQVGDMHKMPFQDGVFDAVYACHSLEHSYDAHKVIAEFLRVTKPGALITIEVPVRFKVSLTDRWDFKSAAKLVEAFGDAISDTLYCHEDDQVVARVIVRKKPLESSAIKAPVAKSDAVSLSQN